MRAGQIEQRDAPILLSSNTPRSSEPIGDHLDGRQVGAISSDSGSTMRYRGAIGRWLCDV